MKLHSTQALGPAASTISVGAPGRPSKGGPSFDEALTRATQADPTSPGPLSSPFSGSVQAASPLGEIRATMPAIAPRVASPTAQRTTALLTLLEDYSQKMASPDVPLKEIGSLVGELGSLAKELSASLADEPDPRIRELAEQSATLAGIESVKFRRGDYL